MQQADLNQVKSIIKSLVIANKEGITLSQLQKDYQENEGNNIPYSEFGFNSLKQFLQSIGETVKFSRNKYGEEILKPIYDENTAHIQKLVSSQKSSRKNSVINKSRKCKSQIIMPTSNTNINTRIFSRTIKNEQEKNIILSKPHLTNIKQDNCFLNNNDKINIYNLLIKYGSKGLDLSNFNSVYLHTYDSRFDYKSRGFNSLIKALRSIPNVCSIQARGGHSFYAIANLGFGSQAQGSEKKLNPIYKASSSPLIAHKITGNIDINSYKDTQSPSSNFNINLSAKAIIESKFQNLSIKEDYLNKIPPLAIKNLTHIIKSYPNGIPMLSFCEKYSHFTGHELDYIQWGFVSAIEVFYALPDIFEVIPPCVANEKRFPGSKNDYILYDASNVPKYVDKVAKQKNLETKKVDWLIKERIMQMLISSKDGIPINNFSTDYFINFEDILDPSKWGFADFVEFFISLSSDLPLEFRKTLNGHPYIVLKNDDLDKWVDLCVQNGMSKSIRFCNGIADVVLPGTDLAQLEIDKDHLSINKWFPTIITSLVNPTCVWLQLRTPEHFHSFNKLSDDLQFYNINTSSSYYVPENYLMVGFYCCALFSGDKTWQRARITKILQDKKRVTVYFVDYGGFATVNVKNLRLLRRKFSSLPAQAIGVSLKDIEPYGNNWDIKAREVLLQFSESDYYLYAQFYPRVREFGDPAQYNVKICDTNKEKDVFLHQVLIDKKLAKRSIRLQSKNEDETIRKLGIGRGQRILSL